MKQLVSFVIFLSISLSIHAQNASVQLIHAISDTNLKTVDFWLFNTKIADNISFREATEFISFPAVIQSQLRICDSASTDTINPLFLFKEQLVVGEKYFMVLSGIADSTASYSHYKPISAHLTSQARELSQFAGYSDGIFFHAATDLEALSISETRELFEVVETNIDYGDYSDYKELETSNYRFRLKELSNLFPSGEYDAFMSSLSLDDSSVVILISGFKHPELNSDGASLGIDLITSSGNVYALPMSSGKVQFLHNSADPDLDEVDIYINNKQELNSLDFLSASGYLTFPSGTELEVAITRDSASTSNESVLTKSIVIDASSENIGMLYGTEFSPIQPLDIQLKKARSSAASSANCDILFFNGSTDFGTTTIREASVLNSDLFTSVEYGDFTEYISLPATNYKVDVFKGNALFTSKGLNLENYNLSGAAITLLTAGFADTAANSNGEEFGLWFARSSSGRLTKLSEPVGITGLETNDLRFYPNPASSDVQISASSDIDYVRIYNTQGQVILNERIQKNSASIDVKSIFPGIYIIEFSINGSKLFDRLIIE